ncbi:transposable element Tc1 transposase [Trichonephila clavipes]|nr:transposable element Tc1 transposase [Trichonephila clavipes]
MKCSLNVWEVSLRLAIASASVKEDLAGMYPLCGNVGSSGEGKVLTQEDRVPGGYVALLRGKTAVFGVRVWRIALGQLRASRPIECIPLTPSHCRLRSQWWQARAHRRTEWRSAVFLLMKPSSALVPVMAVCWSEEG